MAFPNNKLKIFASMFAINLFGIASIVEACELPQKWLQMKSNDQVLATASILFDPQKVPLGQSFTAQIIICRDDDKVPGRIGFSATMPAHRHGMNYRPDITTNNHSQYRASGLFLHMPGEWQFALTAYWPNKTEYFTIDLLVQ